jgi:SAM-dependent methyltransferase
VNEENEEVITFPDGRTEESWIAELAPWDGWNERHAMALFALIGKVHDYLDVGCGTGAMVNLARKVGILAWGVDQLPRPEDYLFEHDLRQPFSLAEHTGNSVVDLVTCFEVAEHLPPEADNIICDTIANHVRQGGLLFFSAAHPGQGGHAHIGLRPNVHWHDKFYERGLTYIPDATHAIALIWRTIPSPLTWLYANVQVFKR